MAMMRIAVVDLGGCTRGKDPAPPTIEVLHTLKAARGDKCRCKCNKYLCHPCRRLKQHLCKQYHQSTHDPVAEIAGRIAYEYVFDHLDAMHLEDNTWLSYSVPNRDPGHTRRLRSRARLALRTGNARIGCLDLHAALVSG
jgi:hypothetical protein